MEISLSKRAVKEIAELMKRKASFEYYPGGDVRIVVAGGKITGWDINNKRNIKILNWPK